MKSITGIAILIFFVVIVVCLPLNCWMGVGGWGPQQTWDILVTGKHVDYSGSGDEKKSHYMVGTDQGAFEVDNGWLLGIWNADDLYGKMQENHRYHITTKGNRHANFFMQEYPYIIKVEQYVEQKSPDANKPER